MLVHGLLIGPEIVEPLDDPLLEVLAHLAEAHVLLDGVHFVPEVRFRGVHVGDHRADVTHDGGKDQDAEEEVDCDEEILRVLLRLRRLTNGGQRQRGPVEAVDVLRRKRIITL